MVQHRRNKKILSLRSEDGRNINSHEDISSEINNFYNKLLKEPMVDRSHTIREITNNIPTILNLDHKKMFLREVLMQEVEEVVMSMPKGEAPRLDGLTIDLYKICWSFIKDEVRALMEESRVN